MSGFVRRLQRRYLREEGYRRDRERYLPLPNLDGSRALNPTFGMIIHLDRDYAAPHYPRTHQSRTVRRMPM